MPSTQKKLIQLSKALGYRADSEGMCYGISCMAVQAILADDLANFEQRLHYLASYKHSSTLKNDITAVQAKVRAKKSALSEDDKEILDILSFFDGMELYQHPQYYQSLFSTKLKPQSFLENLTMLIPTGLENIENNIGLKKQFTHLYNKASLKNLLVNLKSTLEDNSPCPLLISANSHAIVVHYDPHAGWLLINPNKLPSQPINSEDEMVEKIFDSFSFKETKHSELCMNIEMYGKSRLDKKTEKNLKALEKQQITNISSEMVNTTLPNVKSKYSSLLSFAAAQGNLDVVQKCLTKKTSVGLIKQAIEYAIGYNNFKIFKMLYNEIEPLDIEEDLLAKACQCGNVEVANYLLKKVTGLANQPSNDTARTLPLETAILANQAEVVQLLLQRGADVEKRDRAGRTALLQAAYKGKLALVKILLNKADTNAKDHDGNSLLTYAALSQNLKLTKYLVNALQLDLNPKNKMGNSLLSHLLTDILRAEKYWKIADYLLSKGAQINPDEFKQLQTANKITINKNKANKLGLTHLAELFPTDPKLSVKNHSLFKKGHRQKDTNKKSSPTPTK